MDFLVADFVLETLSPNLLVFPKVMKPEASNVIVIIIKDGIAVHIITPEFPQTDHILIRDGIVIIIRDGIVLILKDGIVIIGLQKLVKNIIFLSTFLWKVFYWLAISCKVCRKIKQSISKKFKIR